ncbi:uncharacterized protein M6B38_411030 [Iris pallida]|uniref:N-acetyltransferase domain-containing protein n=1 Tax=Iris pallida TaxID=29817 RepID=A0AAX6FMM3_IRIPA|nr:uncharacterized protein M6B38_411030 [Iris pallida]
MRSVPLSLSPSPFISRVRVCRTSSLGGERFLPRPSNSGIHSEPGVRGASQAVDLFPTLCPEIVVRDARLEDCWEVADTHINTFFPNYTFPLDLLLRINRFMGLLSGFSVPSGCMRTCLVAVTGPALNENLFIAIEDFKIGGFGGKFSFNRWSVSGILTLDTVADFLPRKGPFRQRRTGVAYISNVAVRESERRKGVAKVLVAEAEAKARSWGCRSIALHCDADNLAAVRLYMGQGFRIIKVSKQAKWPQPRTSPNVEFHFMMKLLSPSQTSSGSS